MSAQRPELAAELARFETSQVLALKELVDLEGLDCDFHLTRAIDVYMDSKHAAETAEAYERLLRAGVVDMKDVAFTDGRHAERVGCPRHASQS